MNLPHFIPRAHRAQPYSRKLTIGGWVDYVLFSLWRR
jgi:hypothetical protein